MKGKDGLAPPATMPISENLYAAAEDIVNHLAAESVLATPGRDDGLVPAFSLVTQLAELCGQEPSLAGAASALAPVRDDLERRLDAAQPFDAASLERIRALTETLPAALAAARDGRPPPQPGPHRGSTGEGEDEVLSLDLAASRDVLNDFYGESVEHLQHIEAALLALEHQPDEPEALNSIFRAFHTIKGNAGFLGLGPMHRLAHEVESLLDKARTHKLKLDSRIITEILGSRDALQALTQQVGTALETGKLPERVVPTGGLIASLRRLAESGPERAVADSKPGLGTPAPAPGAESGCPAPAGQTVRVATEKLDSLMDVVGELVVVQSQLSETARGLAGTVPQLARAVAQVSRITKELQNTAMSLRMIPIKPTFQKMERLARDLAREFGKKVSFTTTGEETELDRTMVEQIGDPLVHMVRNALDHGIEGPAERISHGKPETGTVNLRAFYQGNHVILELQDDGRGLAPEKILTKARSLHLAPEDADLTKEEIFALIFLPGFSTAEKVTAVSGRGVGMDVVRRNIENKLRGKIEISSEAGRGSLFSIKLPLTLAIIDGLIVRVGGDRFILPSTSVQMALRPTRESVLSLHGNREMLDVRGRMIPLHRLHRRFGIPAAAMEPWDGIVLILESSGRFCALLVDEMVSKQEVVIKSLGAFMQDLPGVSGGAILGDGNIALILDPGALLHAA
jgi:two-component system chemotaxis sensor kinase CheA